MDYEKKYKEALERAKEIIECSKSDTKEVRMVLSFFPELKENGDEKIRAELISNLKETIENINNEEIIPHSAKVLVGKMQKWIVWLEMQGEQKPAEWSEEDEKTLSDIIKDLVHPWNEYIPDRIEDEIKWLKNKLKSLRPQNRWKPSDESIEYTRTDAFIEKAAEWLRSNTLGYVDVSMDFEDMKLDKKFFKDFKNYMKGE